MKTYSVLLALATLATAAGCASSSHEASDEAAASNDALTSGWQNVLSLSVASAGYINTLEAPHMTLRPTRGIYMRMSWPLACNAQITGMSLYTVELQEKRHLADYHPIARFRTSDAKVAISTARNAISRFRGASNEDRKAFLTLLICPPR